MPELTPQHPGKPLAASGFGRRVAALCIDWLVASLVTRIAFLDLAYPSNDFALITLGIFYFEVALLTWLTGASFGQRLVGVTVVRTHGGRLSMDRVALRTLLICLVIPAVIYDSDGRGLHDRAVDSIVIPSRG